MGVPGAREADGDEDNVAVDGLICGSESNGLERSWPFGPARGVRSAAEVEGQNLSMMRPSGRIEAGDKK